MWKGHGPFRNNKSAATCGKKTTPRFCTEIFCICDHEQLKKKHTKNQNANRVTELLKQTEETSKQRQDIDLYTEFKLRDFELFFI